jgi:hypothetical protein
VAKDTKKKPWNEREWERETMTQRHGKNERERETGVIVNSYIIKERVVSSGKWRKEGGGKGGEREEGEGVGEEEEREWEGGWRKRRRLRFWADSISLLIPQLIS